MENDSCTNSDRPRFHWPHRRMWSRTVVTSLVIATSFTASTLVGATSKSTATPLRSMALTGSTFGSVVVGKASAEHSSSIPLSTTIGVRRTQIVNYINSPAVTFADITFYSATVITADQEKSVVLTALAGLADTTKLAWKITSATLVHGTNYAFSGDCLTLDGANTPSCTLKSKFTPISGGPLSDGVNVSIMSTQGFDTISAALGTQLTQQIGLSGYLLTLALGILGPSLHTWVDAAISSSISPVVSLSGLGLPVLSLGSSLAVPEGNSGPHKVMVPVSINAISSLDVHVSFATADGGATVANHDYVASKGSAVIKAGQLSVAIPITIIGDKIVEPNATVGLKISSPINAVVGIALGHVTILNDDRPGVTVVGSTVPAGAPAYFSLTLAQPYFKDTTLHVHLASGTAHVVDYGTLGAATVLVPTGSTGPFFVFVSTVVNRAHEADESFSLVVTGGASTVSGASTIRATAG
jgi:hypothetical protein